MCTRAPLRSHSCWPVRAGWGKGLSHCIHQCMCVCMRTACGYRDQVYLSGCISFLSNIVKHGGTDSALCASGLPNIVGAADDLTDARAKVRTSGGWIQGFMSACVFCPCVHALCVAHLQIAVRDGLPVAVCQLALACIKDHISKDELSSFVDFAVRTLRALVRCGNTHTRVA